MMEQEMSDYYQSTMCFSKLDIDHSDELLRPMDNILLNESLWNE